MKILFPPNYCSSLSPGMKVTLGPQAEMYIMTALALALAAAKRVSANNILVFPV